MNPLTGESGPPTAPATDPPMVQMMKNMRTNQWWDDSWTNRNANDPNAREKYENGWDRIFGEKND